MESESTLMVKKHMSSITRFVAQKVKEPEQYHFTAVETELSSSFLSIFMLGKLA